MTQYIEYKNETEETEIFQSLNKVIESSVGWFEVYQDMENESYQNEIDTLKMIDTTKENVIAKINDVTEVIGYSYKVTFENNDDTIKTDVLKWLEKAKHDYKDGYNGALIELIYNGLEEKLVPYPFANNDIHAYYKKHEKEINDITKEQTGYSIHQAVKDEKAFDVIINNIGGLDCEMMFKDSKKLETDELIYLVWNSYETVAEKILKEQKL